MCVERAVGRSHNVRSWPIDVSTNNCMHATGSARLISVCVRACSRIHPLRPFPTCMLSIWRDHVRLARRAPGGHNHRRSLSGINPSIAPPLRPRVQEMLQEVPRAATDASAVPSVGLGCFCCLGSRRSRCLRRARNTSMGARPRLCGGSSRRDGRVDAAEARVRPS